MIKHFDHVTIVVADMEAAVRFMELLGFSKVIDTEISGQTVSDYMGIPELRARHVTLVLKGADPRQEVQLLHIMHPTPRDDPSIARLDKLGYNHLCLAVDDIAAEVARFKEHGVEFKSRVMEFHDRKLIFFTGPGGVTLELAQWV